MASTICFNAKAQPNPEPRKKCKIIRFNWWFSFAPGICKFFGVQESPSWGSLLNL